MKKMTQAQIREAIGRRLKMARRAAGFRFAKDFSEKLDIDQNSYTPYERGVAAPPVHKLDLIKQHTGVTMDWLYLGETANLTVRVLEALTKEAEKEGLAVDGTPLQTRQRLTDKR